MVRTRLQPEHFPVLYPQLTDTLMSQGFNFAPFGCVLVLFRFAHSGLWFLSAGSDSGSKEPIPVARGTVPWTLFAAENARLPFSFYRLTLPKDRAYFSSRRDCKYLKTRVY